MVGNVNACVDGVNFLLLYLSFLLEPVLTALIAVSACTPPRRSYAFAFFLQDGFHKRMFEVRVSWCALTGLLRFTGWRMTWLALPYHD